MSGMYRSSRAHPRSRGENQWRTPAYGRRDGSSPLTRGKRSIDDDVTDTSGLIPAHAGKTSTGFTTASQAWAHPRSRGENYCAAAVSDAHAGSSPLTRGKRVRSAAVLVLIWAHPRSRGENTLDGLVVDLATGSSPLTRGKHFLTCAFIAQIDQILESLELCAFSESYSSQNVYATDAPRDRVRSIGLAPRSSRGAS